MACSKHRVFYNKKFAIRKQKQWSHLPDDFSWVFFANEVSCVFFRGDFSGKACQISPWTLAIGFLLRKPSPRHPGPPPNRRCLGPQKNLPKRPKLRRYDWRILDVYLDVHGT